MTEQPYLLPARYKTLGESDDRLVNPVASVMTPPSFPKERRPVIVRRGTITGQFEPSICELPGI